jgi:biopolymer transport protein TolR
MAFGRLERPQGSQPMSEINMTPLIDVMLVLLVIFMLTAPLMTSRLQLDLPKADAPPSPKPPPATLQIALSADGKTYLADVEVKPDALAQQATLQGKQKPDTEVQLRADRTVPYGRVAELIGVLQKAGLNRIAFVTEAGPDDAAQAPAAAPAAPVIPRP